MFGVYSCLCTQESLLAVLRGLYRILRIKPRSLVCKAKALLHVTVLSGSKRRLNPPMWTRRIAPTATWNPCSGGYWYHRYQQTLPSGLLNPSQHIVHIVKKKWELSGTEESFAAIWDCAQKVVVYITDLKVMHTWETKFHGCLGNAGSCCFCLIWPVEITYVFVHSDTEKLKKNIWKIHMGQHHTGGRDGALCTRLT